MIFNRALRFVAASICAISVVADTASHTTTTTTAIKSSIPTPSNRPPHALLFSIPLPGHMNPLIALGEELVSRGWKVSMSSTSDAAHHVARQAIPEIDFYDIGICQDTLKQEVLERASNSNDWVLGSYEIFLWSTQLHPCMYPKILAKLKSEKYLPDIIIADFASSAGFDVAETLGIPWAANNADLVNMISHSVLPIADYVPGLLSGHSISKLRGSNTLYGLLPRTLYVAMRGILHVFERVALAHYFDYVRSQLDLPPLDLYERVTGRLVLVNAAFPLEYPRPLPPLVSLTGCMIPRSQQDKPHLRLDQAELSWIEQDSRPVVFVSMGTLAPLRKDQVKTLLDGFQALTSSVRILWKLAKPAQVHLPSQEEMPTNVKIATWVSSQFGVLSHPQVRIFISHCGINSAYESLYFNTSLICIPMFMDQHDMALRVVDSGAGLMLHKNFMVPNDVSSHITTILNNGNFSRNTYRLSKAIGNTGGVVKAADLIEHVTEFGTDELTTGDSKYPNYARGNYDAYALLFLLCIPIVYSSLMCLRCLKTRCCNCGSKKNAKTKTL